MKFGTQAKAIAALQPSSSSTKVVWSYVFSVANYKWLLQRSSVQESVNCSLEILLTFPSASLNLGGACCILPWARRKGENRKLPSPVTTGQDESRHRIIGWLGFVVLHTKLSFDTSMALRLPWGLFLSLLKTMSMLMDMSTSQGVGNARVLMEILIEFLPIWA